MILISKIYLFQWAMQVLTIEQNINIGTRLKQQKKYASLLNSKEYPNGRKVFMVRWKQMVSYSILYISLKLKTKSYLNCLKIHEREEFIAQKQNFQNKLKQLKYNG